jgi:mono/diheme cytochrome c family protein
MKMTLAALAFWSVSASLVVAAPGAAQQAQLNTYTALAKAADPAFAGFSAERGKALYLANFTTGKADTPSCTTCHTADPTKSGQTRAGKAIGPMALSVKADRYSIPEDTEKWFGRNCDSVIGRACTPLEKGDFITFMVGQ